MSNTFTATGRGGLEIELELPRQGSHGELHLAEQLAKADLVVDGAGPFQDRDDALDWLRAHQAPEPDPADEPPFVVNVQTATAGAAPGGIEFVPGAPIVPAPDLAIAVAPAPEIVTPAGAPTGVPDGNVEVVLAWVRGAPKDHEPTDGWEARAEQAIAVELAKGEGARKGIVDPLSAALADDDGDDGDDGGDED
ncbi:MAG: hypothetical protein AAGA99_21115 [Actinomycetota bacterium]